MAERLPASAPRVGIIPLLATLHALAPLTTDMYLPSLPLLERVFQASTAEVQRTLAMFFLGFAFGQTLWGPVTDRFGRKPPLYFAMLLFFTASAGCAVAPSIHALAVLRLLQAVGACGGAVIARAMVRDMFPPGEMRRVFSTLISLNAVAPAIAPLAGGLLLAWLGWQSIFWALAVAGMFGALVTYFLLPESLGREARQPLHLGHVFRSYGGLLGDRLFLGSSLVTGFSSAGMFAYIAGSPFVFISLLGVTPQQFSWIFGTNAVGIILGSRINARYLYRFPADRVLKAANLIQLGAGLALVAAAWTGRGGLLGIWAPLFFYVACIGLTFPTGSAIALAGHGRIAGIASALLGTNQFGLAVISTTVLGSIGNTTAIPMAVVILGCGTLATALNFTMLRPHVEPS